MTSSTLLLMYWGHEEKDDKHFTLKSPLCVLIADITNKSQLPSAPNLEILNFSASRSHYQLIPGNTEKEICYLPFT